MLRREVWLDALGTVTHYNLAYINQELCQQDNGRVIGYDNSHGEHHRHFQGHTEHVNFISFPDIEVRFAREVEALLEGRRQWIK
ncbi:hypothetical protein GM658_18370 [Pseudoduganella eburnea]|uniref:Uncharacterized protein n=1 Tax=Massilia eburnea TaxID=1776165 RepID=A0A6L6QJD0_9BURK|nr:hypothetical protein [Massilia eburnea]